ncbi:hypothetical protein C8J56DRAFT_323684 [Mycena floridula]|nr:hypothetical protein C8J56DRAFT_323684 [Mycena floridula]
MSGRHLSRLVVATRPRTRTFCSSISRENPTSFTSGSWKLGDGQRGPQLDDARQSWNMRDLPSRDAYKLLTSCIVPRPIALVSTERAGIYNLAPFSYFSMVSHNPPLISISCNLPRKRPKDTRENILETKEFTVSIISEHFAEAANATSVEAPADVDEYILSGLQMEPSASVKPPYVKESSISFECELHSSQDLRPIDSDEVSTTLILGLIKRVHVRKSVLSDDGIQVDAAKLKPIARMGSTIYASISTFADLPRVSWKTAEKEYNSLKKRNEGSWDDT